MKTIVFGFMAVVLIGPVASSTHAQYQSPRQYMRRLPQTQPPPPASQPALPPGPTVTPAPGPAAPAVSPAAAAKATSEKEATVKRTVEFQKKRAAGGSASAQYTLGVRYVEGDGVEKNLAEGCKWLRAAAKQDYVWAKKKLTDLEKELGRLPPPTEDTLEPKPGQEKEEAPAAPGETPDTREKPAEAPKEPAPPA